MGMHTAHIGCVKLEFDLAKEAANLAKHGVDFSTVLRVFEDPNRMIIPNQTHSLDEPRFYAIGHDGTGDFNREVHNSRKCPPRDWCWILEEAKECL
jgi:uncharacterized DUF497 family protein